MSLSVELDSFDILRNEKIAIIQIEKEPEIELIISRKKKKKKTKKSASI